MDDGKNGVPLIGMADQQTKQQEAVAGLIAGAAAFANEFADGFKDSEINAKFSQAQVAIGLLMVAGQLCGSSVAWSQFMLTKKLPTSAELERMRDRFDQTLRVNFAYGASEVAKRVMMNAALPAANDKVQ